MDAKSKCHPPISKTMRIHILKLHKLIIIYNSQYFFITKHSIHFKVQTTKSWKNQIYKMKDSALWKSQKMQVTTKLQNERLCTIKVSEAAKATLIL
jgi:hypothetical protein